MAKIRSPDVPLIKAQAAQVLKVWKANREFRMKDATVVDFERAHGEFERVLKDIAAKNRELENLRKIRESVGAKLNELCLRARNGIKGYYGPDSSQCVQIRDTPPIARKPRVRQAKPASALPSQPAGPKP